MPYFKRFDLRAKQPNRKPLRNTKELAEEFGVSVQTLLNLLRLRSGPERIMLSKGAAGDVSWYDPDAVRKWWKTLERN